jgi:hypothetical protein
MGLGKVYLMSIASILRLQVRDRVIYFGRDKGKKWRD